MNPRYPIYIPSKSRWGSRLTVKALTARNIPFRIVIEAQEYDQYAAVIPESQILVLPFSNKGAVAARNWIWEHSIQEGHARHWELDDNIRYFFRLHQNQFWLTTDGASFAAIEDLTDRYENLAQSGMQYFMFINRKTRYRPVAFNTRIYSCMLIDNALPFRWRGIFNADTDLSLRLLKAGYCTALFYAFPADKQTTMVIKGGNTAMYQGDGRLKMARSLQLQHPDVVEIKWRWGRWQHVVNYEPFKRNALRLRPGVAVPKKTNEYGMRLVT